MGSASFLQSSFLGGEWSQTAQGNIVDPRYKISMATCLNGIPRDDGAWARRPGTMHAFTTRSGLPAREISFDFKESTPYKMEFTDGYLRFRSGASLVTTNDTKTISSITSLSISAYNASSTYAVGALVSFLGGLYQCASAINLPPGPVTPGSNPTYWTFIGVLSGSTAALVTTSAAHGWSTGNQVFFGSLGANNAALQNRVFTMCRLSATTFTLTDPLTTTVIDPTTAGTFVSGNVSRILELNTIYSAGQWSALRSIQAETKTVLVNGGQQPQLVSAETSPVAGTFATFSIDPFNFIDGPYLDPVSGSYITPSALNGIVTLTLSTQAYDSTRAYNIDDFATYSGATYRSLVGNNQNHQPDTSTSYWSAVNAGAAIGPNGFVPSDVGRHIRLYSEPPNYDSTATYVSGNKVRFPSSIEGINNYYTATSSVSAGEAPGTSTKWALTPTIALWTWGVVTSVSGDGVITPVSAIGDFTNSSAAFSGTLSQPYSSSAYNTQSIDAAYPWSSTSGYQSGVVVYFSATNSHYALLHDYTIYNPLSGYPTSGYYVLYLGGYWVSTGNNSPYSPPGQGNWQYLGIGDPSNINLWLYVRPSPSPTYVNYVGQHFSATAKAISQVTIYPTSNVGFANTPLNGSIRLIVRAKSTAPSGPTDGTILAQTTIQNTTNPITLVPSDTTTTWNYVTVEMSTYYPPGLSPTDNANHFAAYMGVSQVVFYEPNVSNGSVVQVQIQGDALLYNTTMRTWRLGAYSNTTGWPTCGVYHEGRLWLAGSISNRIDASKPNDIYRFSPTDKYGQVDDANSISYTFNARDVNAIFWMEQDQAGILCGTQSGEWLIQATNINQPLTPTSIQAHRVTKIGCANIEPRRTDHTLVFVQKFGRKIMEYFADVFSGKFSAPNLLKNAKHLTVDGIEELVYQQELVPLVWARTGAGSLLGITYQRDSLMSSQGPTSNGVHKHALGSGRVIESVCIGPSADGELDSLSLVTNDTATGVRHVEILTNIWQEGDTLSNAWLLDDAVRPSSYATGTVSGGAPGVVMNGLSHLEGKTVTVFAGGLDLGEWVVSGGSIGVPFSPSTLQTNTLFTSTFVSSFSGTMPILVGFTYTSRGQLLRPDTMPESGSRNGPGFGKVRRIHKFAALLVDTQAIKFGTSFLRLFPAQLKTPGGTALLAANTLFSGIHKDNLADSGEGLSSQLCWEISRPFPATVAGMSGFIETTDE